MKKIFAMKFGPVATIYCHKQPLVAVTTIAALLLTSTSASAEWRFPHGDAANTSFARVNTNVAQRPNVAFTGPMAPGLIR